MVTQDKSGKLGIKLMILAVEDAAAKRKIIGHYLKRKGLGNIVPPDGDILPQAIFFLKK